MKTVKQSVSTKSHESGKSKSVSASGESPLVLAQTLLAAGETDRAMSVLKDSGSNDAITSARGVCLMRSGRAGSALELYRQLVVKEGCTWLRPDTPVIHRTNYCTALLLSGHPDGAVELINSIEEQSHPSVIRLQQAITAWQSKFTLWQRLQWKMGLVPNVPFQLGFPPGDILDPVTTPRAESPSPTDVTLKQAV